MLAGPKSPQILLTEEIVGSEILLAEDFERLIYGAFMGQFLQGGNRAA